MPTYLVLKRVKEDWVSLPGELLIDPPNFGLLISRGYIIPVPDNYPGAVSKPVQEEVPPPPPATVELPLASADSPLELESESPPVPTKHTRPVARVTHRR
jgi:hypothetical protein